MLARILVLFSIVYFYSNAARFAVVSILGFFLYAIQGLGRERRERERYVCNTIRFQHFLVFSYRKLLVNYPLIICRQFFTERLFYRGAPAEREQGQGRQEERPQEDEEQERERNAPQPELPQGDGVRRRLPEEAGAEEQVREITVFTLTVLSFNCLPLLYKSV